MNQEVIDKNIFIKVIALVWNHALLSAENLLLGVHSNWNFNKYAKCLDATDFLSLPIALYESGHEIKLNYIQYIVSN